MSKKTRATGFPEKQNYRKGLQNYRKGLQNKQEKEDSQPNKDSKKETKLRKFTPLFRY